MNASTFGGSLADFDERGGGGVYQKNGPVVGQLLPVPTVTTGGSAGDARQVVGGF